ncbi:MAG: signal peptidase I [Candidatus Taylorbacteria bacterium RIFCSPHIGHO2_02_FULL_47_18]|uniref:Signal peptidase I n=1 Tax=Candidatus Taylorbacteria bacterium RIFCSPLOWO2_01_FULL_48_100 TaxID=1802322 RepID=A0A1G2NGB9_9BACT|nr:MAG: signal peptidase I [Candidatus Taylorbacteria bacterium RIFCSPHIGHO2_01_FULL_48_38]OHA27904.1 MAG: signal peptidase I [Candidatus Taylorbacteria bacterium RIFCSPHIGHO2_02_FULL_47_18]OHA34441.1 MAG: signal peptidase I [Candidatus Taylorbacteria bacterium RIFCSPLOWO2_01_FULL_48_100]OHA40131.1 MAG: signal peptidase I [Candidatus Taylorbacteria bacterium RIFCSPLOWO2_02_FULL_48_16]OHA45534.1 MAG: signal peptidase I [Candidatus Taylorbacteria bacterium RIFCSPLOWO2_12_FULL_48_11]
MAKKIAEIFHFAVIAAVIVIPFRLLIAQPFLVSGDSMVPSFHNNDYLIVDELSYRFREPTKSEVVIFRSPVEPSKYLIKRVIGLPGETVEFLFPEKLSTVQGLTNSVILKDGEYFVEGDNRNESFDSRYWGPLPRANIKGRAFLRLWPLTQIGFFPGATTTTLVP